MSQLDLHATRQAIHLLLGAIGENALREGLKDTPARVARFYEEWLDTPEPTLTTFSSEGMDEMIVQRDIPFYSLCEHHLAVFCGRALVAYIPGASIVGLSKLARVVQWRAKRLQNQERITTEVADYLQDKLNPKGVAVILTARHMCMEMRGVQAYGTETTTSCLRGVLREGVPRAEVMALAGLK